MLPSTYTLETYQARRVNFCSSSSPNTKKLISCECAIKCHVNSICRYLSSSTPPHFPYPSSQGVVSPRAICCTVTAAKEGDDDTDLNMALECFQSLRLHACAKHWGCRQAVEDRMMLGEVDSDSGMLSLSPSPCLFSPTFSHF